MKLYLYLFFFFLFNSFHPSFAITQKLSTIIHQSSNGLTFDLCSKQQPCSHNYTCQCDDSGKDCRCLPLDDFPDCSGSQDCVKGEVCQNNFCTSLTSDVFTQQQQQQQSTSTNSQSNQSETTPTKSSSGNTKQQTTKTPSNIKSDEDQAIESTEAEDLPFSSGEVEIDSDLQVTNEETSVQSGPVTVDNVLATPSPSPIPRIEDNSPVIVTPESVVETSEEFVIPGITDTKVTDEISSSEEASDVCIDKELLKHLSSEEMIFDTHRNGRVVCDNNDSCATPGHMIEWNGKAMMMSSYCKLFVKSGCIHKRILVNSPRYRRALKVNTYTKGLKFTTFASRYETKMEEKVLATILRLGL